VTDETRSAEDFAPIPPRRSRFNFWRQHDEEAATTGDYIVGYVGLWLMVDDAHVVAIAVREAYRGRGLGEFLLMRAIEIAAESRVDNVTLEVRRSNEIAQALYEKYQFLKVGVRTRYYFDNQEDAIIMSTPPIHTPTYQDRLQRLAVEYERKWAGRSDS